MVSIFYQSYFLLIPILIYKYNKVLTIPKIKRYKEYLTENLNFARSVLRKKKSIWKKILPISRFKDFKKS